MIPGNNNFVFVRKGANEVVEVPEFAAFTKSSKVSCVHKDITRRDIKLAMVSVRVTDGHYSHGFYLADGLPRRHGGTEDTEGARGYLQLSIDGP